MRYRGLCPEPLWVGWELLSYDAEPFVSTALHPNHDDTLRQGGIPSVYLSPGAEGGPKRIFSMLMLTKNTVLFIICPR